MDKCLTKRFCGRALGEEYFNSAPQSVALGYVVAT
jgi:hypothetical protein